ncbi:MAG: acyl carrier protein [Chloroflexi bacterium]|nr:acyl carrier protein [Chloroflexota bacterium]
MMLTIDSMNLETIAATIKTYIIQTFLYDRGPITLTNETPLLIGGLIDSIRVVQLIGFLQKEFEIEVELEDLTIKNFESIQAMAGLILRYRQKNAE